MFAWAKRTPCIISIKSSSRIKSGAEPLRHRPARQRIFELSDGHVAFLKINGDHAVKGFCIERDRRVGEAGANKPAATRSTVGAVEQPKP
jgi:hypothetical protein